MNGRALNEKAIEVSPSSSRVLDRAAEILTPFPPSKNRPRPGDWTCPSCGFSNFQRRTACFRCSFPAVPAAPGGDPMFGYSTYSPASMVPPQPPSLGHGGGHGMPARSMPSSGGMVPFRAGDWKCGSDNCGYHNFAKNVSCLRCGASRAGAAVVADTAFPSPVDSQSAYGGVGIGPGHGMGGGPGPIGSQFGSGFPGQHFGSQPGNFGMPSALGGGSGFPQLNTSLVVGPTAGGPFDHRAEQAFSSGGNGPNGTGLYSGLPDNEAFSFLSGGLGGLGGLGGFDDRRKEINGGGKSPAA
jgi:hypothetical protein